MVDIDLEFVAADESATPTVMVEDTGHMPCISVCNLAD